MNRILIPFLLAALLLAACGEGEPEQANPLSLVPENAMMVYVLNDPAMMVRNIDGYIEDGAPMLGAAMLENLICEQLQIASLDSMPVKYGFDPSGQVVFFMENAMPQSMVIAASAPDLPLFLSLMEEMGIQFVDEEPIDNSPVYSFDTGDGTLYITGHGGVAVMAMSSSKLEEAVGNLSDQAAIESEPASLMMKFNMAMIGPMAAGQMPMARMLLMQGLQEDPEMPEFVPGIMEVYMQGIELFLTQAELVEINMIVGPEDFLIKKHITFIEGSDLAELLVEDQGRDMLQLIPQGNVATARIGMPEEIAFQVTKAFTEVFVQDVPEENLRTWASMSSNAAFTMFDDQFMHFFVAYELTEDLTIEDVAVFYAEYMDSFLPILAQSPEMADAFILTDNGIVQVDGVDFYSMSFEMNPDTTMSMEFDYWMAIHDGALLLETAEQPDLLLDVISGDYQPAELTGAGSFAGEMSLAGYLGLILSFSPNGMELPEIGSDVIIRWDGGLSDGAIHGEMTLNGRDAVATGFSFFGIIAAAE